MTCVKHPNPLTSPTDRILRCEVAPATDWASVTLRLSDEYDLVAALSGAREVLVLT